ncbi:dTMP kinase [Bacteroidia bacterium]|nr:dTMP kinase [Bacteroidia bacterium]
MIIALYGLDGAGKSTQAEILKRTLLTLGKKVYLMNPYFNGQLTRKIRERSMLIDKNYEDDWGPNIVGTLLLQDLWDNVLEAIHTHPDEIIIFDRYCLDYYVYSPLLNSNLEFYKPILDSFPRADINIFLDTNPQTCYERILKKASEKGLNICKREDWNILQKARDSYLILAKENKDFFVVQTGENIQVINSHNLYIYFD